MGGSSKVESYRMPCKACDSAHVREFPAELNVHFPGMEGLDIPTVWVFATIAVCMDCGAAQFTVTETERKELADKDYREFVDGTAV